MSFSIDEFERVKVTTWEGVRNHEAKKYALSLLVAESELRLRDWTGS